MYSLDEILKEYYSLHDKYSVRTSWHRQHLIENVIDLQGFIESISGNLEDERRDDSKNFYPLGYFQIEQPSRIRYTHIVFLFTILERRVRSLIKLIIELTPTINKSLSDYNGSFLERIKQFLFENLNIDVSSSDKWNSIMTYQKVRDCIIHCGGNVTESRDETYLRQLASESKIFLNNNNYILLTNDFCSAMESTIIEFISDGLDVLYNFLADLAKKEKG